MLPEFLNLGYPESEFISDYSTSKLTNEEIKKIKKNFKTSFLFRKVYSASMIDFFIGKYFAASACSNRIFDYSKQLTELKKIDIELFGILENFVAAWKNFDYMKIDLMNSYHTISLEFIGKLEEWIGNKIIK